MFNRPIRLYIEDIKEAISKIESFTKDMVFDDFVKDDRTMDAVIRNIEIIGTRSKVLHEYFGIDEKILWKTVQEDLPLLKKQIGHILISQ